jgi:hypothetical protein
MKKIIIGLMVFFNFGITISNHEMTLDIGSKVYAQHQGDIRCPRTEGNGLDPSWWTTFTTWLQELYGDIISALGELYEDEIGGSQIIGSNYLYPWGTGNAIPYIDVYYNGYGYSYFEIPSIYGGPYRAGRMMNCSNGTSTYIDCAYLEHNTSNAGISGTTADIAYLDECNECVGGNTGLPACSSPIYYASLQYDTTKYYDGDTITIEIHDDCLNWPQITLYNEHGVPPPSIAWSSTSNAALLNGWFGANSRGSLNICNVGNYIITVDSGSMLSHSTIFTNFLNVARTDTAKPTPKICDSVDIKNGQKLTNTYDSIKNLTDFKRVQDSGLVSPNEAGVSVIRNINGTLGTFNFQTGGTGSVNVLSFDSTHNIFTSNHAHIKGPTRRAAISPSPGDLYHLVEGYSVIPINHNYQFEYESAYDSSVWAIMINNTDTATLFNTQHPGDSTLQYPAMDDWDSTRILSSTGFSLYSHNLDFQQYFYLQKHYPLEYVKAYADVAMYNWFFNTGVSMFVRQNGQFKKLDYDAFIDANNQIQITITICQ